MRRFRRLVHDLSAPIQTNINVGLCLELGPVRQNRRQHPNTPTRRAT